MAVVTLKPKETNLHISLDQDIRVSGEHTPKGTVVLLSDGTARHLVACNKAHIATEAEIAAAKKDVKVAA